MSLLINFFILFIPPPPATIFHVFNFFFFSKPPRHVTRDQHQITCAIAFLSLLPWHCIAVILMARVPYTLKIAKNVLENHNFRIRPLHNEPTAAASFQFTFPCCQVFFRTIETNVILRFSLFRTIATLTS